MQTSWDKFWQQNADSRFTKASWSKRRIMRALHPYLTNGLVVLDAGSGSGFFSRFFNAQGCETYSLDYSEEALAITRRQTGNQSAAYLCRDLLDRAFAGEFAGRFHLVFSDGLFEHFSSMDQNRLFEHFKMIKKPGGIIATFVPNKYSFWTFIRPLLMPGISEKPFTLGELRMLYARNGCSIVEAGGINVFPIRYSPDVLMGSRLGMLVYAIGQ
jgi:2-polyprenyl-3-methyl-5-hydroxy-6-metoxy-1,4-benzoquinol methylase